ncbi:hypothetical protein WMY93_031512 [Mugilogobius chulae]|uniref:V-type proton ATPase subunit G n=1 Tax=Mugilogobius chulae TaxID=88201 RepID=A0AAW0MFI4_9GOBI
MAAWTADEEAVNEVKRQAMDEVQKAVAEAEQKAFEMIASERAKMEKTLAEAKRKAQEDAILVHQRTRRLQRVLLELRPKSQRDLQRVQRGPVLRLLLPAQGLGAPPPHLQPGPPSSAQTHVLLQLLRQGSVRVLRRPPQHQNSR